MSCEIEYMSYINKRNKKKDKRKRNKFFIKKHIIKR